MVGLKNRYLLVEVFLDPNKENPRDGDPIIITQFNVSKAIKDSILLNFGECGLASSISSFQVKYVNPITKLCVIRVSRDEYQKVWAAITMVRSIANCPLLFNLLHLTGNTRAAKNTALKLDELKLEQYKLVAGPHIPDHISHQMRSSLLNIQMLDH